MEISKPKADRADEERYNFLAWSNVGENQLEEIRQLLKNTPFKRLEKHEGSFSEFPPSVEIYKDDMKNLIAFLYPESPQGNIKVLCSPPAYPILLDALGQKEDTIDWE